MPRKINAPRRFLIDGTVFEQPLTGVARATVGLYQGLLEIDDSLEITICHRQPLQGEIPETIKTVQLPAENSTTWRTSILSSYVHQNKYDVVHFPWNGGIPPNLSKQVLKILTLHDVLPLMIPNYFRNPLRKLKYKTTVGNSLNRADLVITDSNYSRRQIMDKFRCRTEPLVIYPASPLLSGSTPATVRSEEFFLFCGGYDKRKGIELLLETFIALWKSENFRIPLWLAGASQEYSARLSILLSEARKLGAIKELGYISDEQITHCYRNAMALVYPSRYEGFGLPPLEAMALGCPVLTYPLTSLPEVCGDAVFYLDPQQDQSLKECILELAHDEALRQKLSEMGKRQAEKFSWSNSARLFSEAIDKRYDLLKL